MRKILVTVTTDLTYDQRMQRICLALQEHGYDVTLIGRVKKNSLKLRTEKYKQHRIKCIFEKGKLFYIEYNIRLLFLLLSSRFDILCSVDLDSILPGYIVSRLMQKPIVFDAHEYFTEIIEIADRPLIKRFWTWVEKFTVPNIKYAYTVSESLEKIFTEKYTTPFITIRNLPFLRKGNPEVKQEKYLIYAGAVNQGRGLESIIEAMNYIDCKLYICGDGDILDKLRTMVAVQRLETKVLFLGYVEPARLELLIQGAYLGYLILENISLSYYYSLANKFFDYIHAGIPQVTINFPEYALINSKYKVAELINLDVNEIVKATNRFLNDQVYYDSFVKNTQDAKKVYNWQLEQRRLIEFYQTIDN